MDTGEEVPHLAYCGCWLARSKGKAILNLTSIELRERVWQSVGGDRDDRYYCTNTYYDTEKMTMKDTRFGRQAHSQLTVRGGTQS